MTRRVESISRRMIAESDVDHSYWLPSYHSMSGGVFRTKAYDEDYRNEPISAPEDFASEILYNNLQDASAGRLEIPEHLLIDQVEDWFVASAMKRGLEIYAGSQALMASWASNAD